MEPASLQAGEPEEQYQWYVLRGEEQVGPVSFGDLLKLVQQGLLLASHFVWKPGFSTWVRADTVAGLFLPPAPLPKAPVETDHSQYVGIITESLGADSGQQTGSEHPVQQTSSESTSTSTPSNEKGEVSRKSNYFVRHWRGQLSLPVSWWINGSLASGAAAMLVIALIEQLKGSLTPDAALPTVLGIFGSIYLLAMWQVVGTWRSATAYGRIHPRRWWGTVAKLLLIVALLRISVDFVQYTAPTVSNLYESYQSARTAKSLAGTIPISQQVAFTGPVADNRAAIFTRAEIRAALNTQTEVDACKTKQLKRNVDSRTAEGYCVVSLIGFPR